MRLVQVTPFVRVPDLPAALTFFCDVLGFAVGFQAGTYAYVQRDGAAFRLIEDRPPEPMGEERYAYYIDVVGVDALYASLKPKLDTLPAGTVTGLCDQEYGQREFTVLAPDGNILAFGEGLEGIASRTP